MLCKNLIKRGIIFFVNLSLTHLGVLNVYVEMTGYQQNFPVAPVIPASCIVLDVQLQSRNPIECQPWQGRRTPV